MSGKTKTKIVIFRWRTTKKDIICALGPYKRSPGSTMNPAGRTDAGSGCGANISTLYSVFDYRTYLKYLKAAQQKYDSGQMKLF